MKRLRVTLSKNAYQELIESIEKANKDLGEFTRQSINLEPTRRTRRSKRVTVELKLIRKHAASLYQALVRGKAWKCQCRNHHQASLRLEPRPQALEDKTLEADPNCKFRILLSNTKPSSKPAVRIQWQEIEVRPSISEAIMSLSPAPAKKGVRFAMATSVKTAPPASSQQHTAINNSASAIADICSIIWESPHPDERIGFLTDENDCEHKHFLYRANTFSVDKPQSRSLREVLSETRANSPRGTLLKRERLEIAVTLASSVLQLDGTSWLNSRWSTDDIYFHNKAGESCTSLTYPYLPWRQCTVVEDLSSATRSLRIGSHLIRSESLFALGLALIELCFGRPLSILRKPEDDDAVEATALEKCAIRLLDFVYDEMDDVYEVVVRRCLYPPFDVRDMSLDNEDVQQKVYSEIVAPLFENLNNLKGKSRIR